MHQRWGPRPLLESVGNLLRQELEYQDHRRPIVVVAARQQPLVRFLGRGMIGSSRLMRSWNVAHGSGDDRQLALDALVERRPRLALEVRKAWLVRRCGAGGGSGRGGAPRQVDPAEGRLVGRGTGDGAEAPRLDPELQPEMLLRQVRTQCF